MKNFKLSAFIITSFLFSLFLFIVAAFAQESTNFRNLTHIKIDNYPLLQILEIHDIGLKQIESEVKSAPDNDYIKKELSEYLQKNDLDLECLKEADLSKLNLINIDLRFFNLKETNLSGSSLQNANLKFVNLKEANLINADFSNANLESANLKEAEVENAKFNNANLQNVDIHEATGLTIDQLLSTKSLYKTILPEKLELKIIQLRPELLKKP
jgi:uncharacterized protein YjbI with pentapeptide repeats